MMSESVNEDDDYEQLNLPTDTLDALQDFYREKDAREQQFEDLKARAEHDHGEEDISMDAFSEDWNSSQFWYTDETALTLAKELLDGASNETWIAVVSAPSVYIQLTKVMRALDTGERPQVRLLEFDERFAVFRDCFVKYDFAEPLRLPNEMKGRFQRVICDPPFLSAECQTKVALTARWLGEPTTQPDGRRLIVCTGTVMEPLVTKLYAKERVRPTTFAPQHSKGLSNEFGCFANYEGAAWKWA